jgi:multidrug transporter EmrE-like cation transporter
MLDNPLLDAALAYGQAQAHRLIPVAPGVGSYGADVAEENPAVNFTQASKFGNMSANIVLTGALLGFALDDYLASKVKSARGWGPIVGAVAGVSATNALAGLSQGVPASTGYALGGAGALVPVAVAALLFDKGTESKTTVKVLAALAGLSVVTGVVQGVMRRR